MTVPRPLRLLYFIESSGEEFIFMVNHLARGDANLRQRQASGLKSWAESQTLPIVAVGDYNFDYDIDEGLGNPAFDSLQVDNVWAWIRPERLNKTQFSSRFYSVLDFIFIANEPPNCTVDSSILTNGFPSQDDGRRSDHRPVEARILIN